MAMAPWTAEVKGLLGSNALPLTAWQGQVQQAVAYRNHPLLRACYALPPVSSRCRSASCATLKQIFQIVTISASFHIVMSIVLRRMHSYLCCGDVNPQNYRLLVSCVR